MSGRYWHRTKHPYCVRCGEASPTWLCVGCIAQFTELAARQTITEWRLERGW